MSVIGCSSSREGLIARWKDLGKVLRSGTTRRRVLVGAAVLVVLCTVVPLFALGAGASDTVTNPGNVGVSMSLSVLTLGQNELGIQTLSPARGTIYKNGALTVFGPSITFAPITMSVDVGGTAPATIVIDTVSLGDFSGGVDPRSGKALLRGAIVQHWSWQDTPTTCPVGPVFVDASTNAQGARPYTDVTGSTTVVDDHVTMNAVAAGTPGCDGLEGVVNAELQLPITPPTTTTTSASSAQPHAADATSSTSTSTSTSTSSTSTTTAAPVSAPDAANALGAQSPPPPPVPSIVLTATISPPPSAHASGSSTTTAPPQVSTAPTTPTTARQAVPPPAPPFTPHPNASPHGNQARREKTLAERRKEAKRALELALAAKKKEKKGKGEFGPSTTVPQLGPVADPLASSNFPPMTWAKPRKHRNALSSLRALPARAISSTSTGGWPIMSFVLLVAMALGGVALIRSEVKRSRPRHRLRFQSIEPPPDEEGAGG
jgi:hypothetical protein